MGLFYAWLMQYGASTMQSELCAQHAVYLL